MFQRESTAYTYAADDDTDPVVAEYPVLHGGQLNQMLHLFAFPLRNANRPYESAQGPQLLVTKGVAAVSATGDDDTAAVGSNVEASASADGAVVNPTSRLSLLYDVFIGPTNAASFGGHDPMKAKGDAAALDPAMGDDFMGAGEADTTVYRHRLETAPGVGACSYAAALFHRGAVYLTGIRGVHHFYPKVSTPGDNTTFAHIDSRHMSSVDNEHATSASATQHLERQARKLRSVTLQHDLNTVTPVDFKSYDHPDSVPMLSRLLCPDDAVRPSEGFLAADSAAVANRRAKKHAADSDLTDGEGEPGHAPAGDPKWFGMQTFFPFEAAFDELPMPSAGAGGGASRIIPLRFAHRAMNVDEQVRHIIVVAKQVAVPDLQRCVFSADRATFSYHRLVQALRRHAVAVHGVWISFFDAAVRGFVAPFVRELVLTTFALSSDATLSAASLLAVVGPSARLRAAVKQILRVVATLNPATKMWTLNRYDDGQHSRDLLRMCPAEHAAQLDGWRQRRAQVEATIQQLANGASLRLQALTLRTVQDPQRAVAMPGGANPTPEAQERQRKQHVLNARRFIREAYEMHGVILRDAFRQRIRDMVRVPGSLIFGVAPQLISEVAREELLGFGPGCWVLAESGDPTVTPFRRYFIDAILQSSSFTTREIINSAYALLRKDPALDADLREQVLRVSAGVAEPDAAALAKEARVVIKKDVALRILNELTVFHHGEARWHVKTGHVQFPMH